MERIRVMHVIARMNVGGPAVEITELMRGMDEVEFEQRLVTGWCADDEADYLKTQALDVVAVRLDGLGRSIRPMADSAVLANLIRQMRSFRPHVIHTHTAKAGVLGRVAAKASRTGARVVHTYHGHLLHGYFGDATTRAVIEGERQLARVTDSIVTVGDRVRTDLIAAGIGRPDQYTVIRSGVRLGPLPDSTQARQELGVPAGATVVSMIGRLARVKRPDRFADVVELLRDRGLDVHFIVAGGGDEEPGLRRRIDERSLPVSLLGWRSDLERVLAATDIAILTSDNEGTPLSLVQSGLAHVPAVATDVGSVREVVADGVTGILCQTSVTSLADGIVRLMSAPLRQRMGVAARAKAIEEYEPGRFLRSHEDLYRDAWARLTG